MNKRAVILVLLFPAVAWAAAPTITKLSTTQLADGNNLVITGTNFGTKATAAPLVWEDFDDGVIDSDMGLYGLEINSEPTEQRTGSTKNAEADYSETKYNCGYTPVATSVKWFVQYWYRLPDSWVWGNSFYTDPEGGYLSNIKFFRVYPLGGNYVNYFTGWSTWWGQNKSTDEIEGGSGAAGQDPALGPRTDVTVGTWHLHEFEYAESSVVDTADGISRFWFDCSLKLEQTGLVTFTAKYPQQAKNILICGFYNSWALTPTHVYSWFDDMYIDTTWARVMVGNESTWATCTQREVQIPSAWATNEITVSINAGSFVNGTNVWVYVVNADGEVNSTGYPASFGAPAADSILVITKR